MGATPGGIRFGPHEKAVEGFPCCQNIEKAVVFL
jgi:hypothetical protein